MRKKTIAILFGVGFGLAIVASIVMVGGAVVLGNAASSCDYSTYSSSYCNDSTAIGGFSALLILGGLLAMAGGILELIAWIAILIKQAQRQQWAWFICTLIFGSICMLIWLIIEPEQPRVLYAPLYQPVQPGYPPAYPVDGPYPSTSYSSPEQPYYQDPYRPQ